MSKKDEPTVYYPENPFAELFGGNSDTVMQIINTMMDMPTYGYTKNELAEVSGVSISALLSNWSRLTKHEVVEQKPTDKGRTKYQLNQDSDIVEKLYKLGDEVRQFREENGLAEQKTLNED